MGLSLFLASDLFQNTAEAEAIAAEVGLLAIASGAAASVGGVGERPAADHPLILPGLDARLTAAVAEIDAHLNHLSAVAGLHHARLHHAGFVLPSLANIIDVLVHYADLSQMDRTWAGSLSYRSPSSLSRGCLEAGKELFRRLEKYPDCPDFILSLAGTIW